jgi:hypothetical protein
VTLFFILIINILMIILFTFYKKSLHILEVFTYWCFSAILIQNYSAILYVNFQKIILSDVISYNWADIANRLILLPMLIIWFLNLCVKSSRITTKLILFFLFSFLLLGIEITSEWMGLITYQNWSIWWSYLLISCILIFSLFFSIWFRKFLYRKDGDNEIYI